MDNPWLNLPKTPPFIAACDVGAIEDPKYKLDGLRFDAFPEPYGVALIWLGLSACYLTQDLKMLM